MEFLNALRFLTIIPVPGDENISLQDLGRSIAWFPLVGAVIGGMLLFIHGLMGFLFQPMLSTALTVTIWVLVTRGFHLDGYGSSFEKIGENGGGEIRLPIMKHTRLGSLGALALVCVLLVKFAALNELKWQFFSKALILAPILGCWAMVLAIRFFPCAVSDGTVDTFRKSCTNREFVIGTISALTLAILLAGTYGLVFLFFTGGSVFLLSWVFTRMRGGLTDDGYGILCEMGEVVSLLSASLIMKMFLSGY